MSHAMQAICCAECQAEIELRCPNGHDVLRQMPEIRKEHRDPIAHTRAPRTEERPRTHRAFPMPKPAPRCRECKTPFPKRATPGRDPTLCPACKATADAAVPVRAARAVRAVVAAPKRRRNLILDALRTAADSAGLTTREIAALTGRDPHIVGVQLGQMRARGAVAVANPDVKIGKRWIAAPAEGAA